MAIDLQALDTEITTDPVSMGYPAQVDSASDVATADILNNASGANPRTVNFDNVDTGAIRGATTFDAFDGLTASEENWFSWLTQNGVIPVNADTLQNLAGVGGNSKWGVADRPVMEPRMLALMQFQGSRAQEIADTLGASSVTPVNVRDARLP